MRPAPLLCLVLGVLILVGTAGAAAPPGDNVLENLQYQVDILGWPEAVRAGIVLKSGGSGRYQAELFAEARGLLAPLSGHRRDTYYTEMVCREGRLQPVVYREESRRKSKHHLKEYRFDYTEGTLELWQLSQAKGLVRKWRRELKGPVSDPLSAFYNCRLGLLGPLAPGETLHIRGIPYPEPEEFEVRLGPRSETGGQAMVSLTNEVFEKKRGVIYVDYDGGRVPTRAWTRILGFGKIVAQLLPTSKSLTGCLPELPGTGASGRPGEGRQAAASQNF